MRNMNAPTFASAIAATLLFVRASAQQSHWASASDKTAKYIIEMERTVLGLKKDRRPYFRNSNLLAAVGLKTRFGQLRYGKDCSGRAHANEDAPPDS